MDDCNFTPELLDGTKLLYQHRKHIFLIGIVAAVIKRGDVRGIIGHMNLRDLEPRGIE